MIATKFIAKILTLTLLNLAYLQQISGKSQTNPPTPPPYLVKGNFYAKFLKVKPHAKMA